MNRIDAALAVRDAFRAEGVRVVTHDEWGSIYDYSGNPDSTQINFNRFSVWHHTGGGSLLAQMEQDLADGHDPVQLGMDRMASVDHFHYWVRDWARGFAYCGACLPWRVDGQLVWFEARSGWVAHGAHLLDPGKNDWPTYYMIGGSDVAVSQAQQEFAAVQNRVLRTVFEFVPSPTNQKKHREVQGLASTQCCDPTLGAFLVAFRERSDLMQLIETYGENRHATLAEAALRFFPEGATKVNIAAGDAYSDLVAAAVAANREDVPVLSVNRDGPLPIETEAALATLGTTTIEVFGGPKAVSAAVREQLRAL